MAESKAQSKKNTKPSNTKLTPKTQSKNDSNKKKKKMSGGAVFSILLLIVVIGALALTYFNIGGLKTMAAEALGLDDPTQEQLDAAEAMMTEAEEKQAEIETMEKEVSTLQRELAQKEEELTAREEELLQKETDIAQREASVDDVEKSEEREEQELAAAVQIFEQMEADKAADAIGGLESTAYMAELLLGMTSEKAAAILNEMKESLATEILSAMMS